MHIVGTDGPHLCSCQVSFALISGAESQSFYQSVSTPNSIRFAWSCTRYQDSPHEKLVPWHIGWSVRFAVSRPGVYSPSRFIPKDFKKMLFTASLLGVQHKTEGVKNKPAILFVMSSGKTPKEMPPSLCRRQVAEQAVYPS